MGGQVSKIITSTKDYVLNYFVLTLNWLFKRKELKDEEEEEKDTSHLIFKELKKQDIDGNLLTFNELQQLKDKIQDNFSNTILEHECKMLKEITELRKEVKLNYSLSQVVEELETTSEPHFSEVLFFPVIEVYCRYYYKNGSCRDEKCKRAHEKERDNHMWKIMEYLSRAEKSIDLCVMTFSVDNYANGIVDKIKEKNIKVRMLTNYSQYKNRGKCTDLLEKNGAEIVYVKNIYLHNKFFIIDNKIVITGSYNFTMQGSVHNYDNTIVTNKPKLVQPFIREFNQIYIETKENKFNYRKALKYPSNSKEINEVYFFPEETLPCQFYLTEYCTMDHTGHVTHDSALIHICSHLLKTEKELNLCLYDMYSKLLIKVMEYLLTKGVQIRLITDKVRSSESQEILKLEEKGVIVIPAKTKSLFHHKFMVSDNKLVVTGSFNWSGNRSMEGFDNIMATNDPQIVNSFVQQFNKLNELFENAKEYVPSTSVMFRNKKGAWDGIIVNIDYDKI